MSGWAVRVNETRVLHAAAPEGAAWWEAFSRLFMPTGRLSLVTPGVIGDTWDVACDSKDHAVGLMQEMVRLGIPKSALKIVVKGPPTCRR